MPHEPGHTAGLSELNAILKDRPVAAQDATRARDTERHDPEDEQEGLMQTVGRPATVSRRSRMEALQDDIRQATEGNPVFEGLDLIAEHAGRFLGSEPGGFAKAPFRFLAASMKDLRKAAKAMDTAAEARKATTRSLSEFAPSAQTNLHFRILDPADQARGGAVGSARIMEKVPVGPQQFEDLPGGASALQIETIGRMEPDLMPGPGTRGNLEAIVDAVRQRPSLSHVTSTTRGTGMRKSGLQHINEQVDELRRTGALTGDETAFQKYDELLQEKEALKIFNREIPKPIRQRAQARRVQEGTDPIMEAIVGGQ